MKEKAAGGALVGAEDLDEGAPGLKTVDREGQVVFCSQCELKRENLPLILELWVLHPAVKATFSKENCSGVQGKEALQLFQPILTAAGNFPGVKAQRGLYQARVTASQCHHVGPVVLTSAVDDAVPDPGIPDRWEKFGQSM